MFSAQALLQTAFRVRGHVHCTPVLSSTAITSLTQANRLVFKCENFQKVGAFKFRGATNAILSLSKDKLALGVCTHSSGNHAAALSLAAKRLEVKAFIVMRGMLPRSKSTLSKNMEERFISANLHLLLENLH